MEILSHLIQFIIDNAMFIMLIIVLMIIPEGRWLAVLLIIGNIISDGNIPTVLYIIMFIVGVLLTFVSPRIFYKEKYQSRMEDADKLLMSLLEREQTIHNIEIELGHILEIEDLDEDDNN